MKKILDYTPTDIERAATVTVDTYDLTDARPEQMQALTKYFGNPVAITALLDGPMAVFALGLEMGISLLNRIVQTQIDSKDFTKVGRDILLSIAHGAGSQLESSKDTVWGLLNGVTAYVDHSAGRNRDSALTSAWYGAGAKLKDTAYQLATELVASRA